jgi:hypothetical protein
MIDLGAHEVPAPGNAIIKDGPMEHAQTHEDGAALHGLVQNVLETFLRSEPVATDDPSRPNSIRATTLSVLEAKSPSERRAIVVDVDEATEPYLIHLDPLATFVQATTPRDYVTDLICAVVYEHLVTDDEIRLQDEQRRKLAADAATADPT